jgi:SAM-dependent methyltransferase
MHEISSLLKRVAKRTFRCFGLEVTRASTRHAGFEVIGEFVSSNGDKFQLLQGYRRSVWPADWDGMNEDRAVPSTETVKRLDYVGKGRDQVAGLVQFLAIHGFSVTGREILEVGCFNGAASYGLTEAGARRVHGIDSANNFVTSEEMTDSCIRRQKKWLDELRHSVRHEFSRDWKGCRPERVSFGDLNIGDLNEVSEYDLIVSMATVEHVLDPRRAFAAMFRALRPGGLSVHNYHPFFCASGAHFDTLDFPWGHVRLTSEDFRQYVRTFRPDEVEIAEYRIFRTINRLTLTELTQVVVNAGFKMIELFASVGDWKEVTHTIFVQSKANYPTLTLTDLTANNVWILLEKPA